MSYSLALAFSDLRLDACSTRVEGSISSLGRLWNMTGQFSEDLFYFPTERKKMQTSRRHIE